jgi:hypothetical protein
MVEYSTIVIILVKVFLSVVCGFFAFVVIILLLVFTDHLLGQLKYAIKENLDFVFKSYRNKRSKVNKLRRHLFKVYSKVDVNKHLFWSEFYHLDKPIDQPMMRKRLHHLRKCNLSSIGYKRTWYSRW